MRNKIFIKELKALYAGGNLVPFIGAGLSIPFSVPDWGKLISEMAEDMDIGMFRPMLDFNLAKYDYWEAVRVIKKYLIRSEQDIQEYIVDNLNRNINLSIDDCLHNYSDFRDMTFTNFITTNYDHILGNFIKSNLDSINLKNINESTQRILNNTDKARVIHLHGTLSDSSSIVISEEKYKELYNDNKYKKIFSLFTGSKTFLFMGFSFNDVFIQRIIEENHDAFKSKHYIILANPTQEQICSLKEKYNIETICYDNRNSSHVEEIRKILREIALLDEHGNDDNPRKSSGEVDTLIDSLPNQAKKLELEKNPFCQKLRVEEIDDFQIDYSKECFFTAEQYIRWLKKSGIKDNDLLIDHMLDLSYMKYKENYINVYTPYKNSSQFLSTVHNELGNMPYARLEDKLSKQKMPIDINKKGFIHLIADDDNPEREVWWGDKRFE